MITYFHRHCQIAKQALARMLRSPISSLVSAAIIGVALSLPLLMFKITENATELSSRWQASDVISVYIDSADSRTDHAALELGHAILRIPQVADVQYLTADQVLDEFKRQAGFSELLEELDSSPLPAMIYVFPEIQLSDNDLDDLVSAISVMERVDYVSYDQQWRNRLKAIVNLFEYGIVTLTALMSLGVILIISNTVRLGILDRRDEIQIIDQIGGTGSYMRRPFLYYGVFQGVIGALVALLISLFVLVLISSPINELAALYNSEFQIQQIDLKTAVAVIMLSAILGWVAARLTAGGYVRKMRASARGK